MNDITSFAFHISLHPFWLSAVARSRFEARVTLFIGLRDPSLRSGAVSYMHSHGEVAAVTTNWDFSFAVCPRCSEASLAGKKQLTLSK